MTSRWLFWLSSTFLVLLVVRSTERYDFCKDKCNPGGTVSFACKCHLADDCHIPKHLDWPQFRREMLDAHNQVRNGFAQALTDMERSVGVTGVSNMMALSYDYDLEYTARCLAKRCLCEQSCSMHPVYGRTGSNLYAHYDDELRDPELIGRLIMTAWYAEEIVTLDRSTMDMLRKGFTSTGAGKNGTFIGHFSQVVWADTKFVGCWYAHGQLTEYSNRDKMETKPLDGLHFLLVCNYAPAGNLVGSPMYEDGRPATKCPEGVEVNHRFHGLCGKDFLGSVPFSSGQYGYDEPSDDDGAPPGERLSSFCGLIVAGSVYLNF